MCHVIEFIHYKMIKLCVYSMPASSYSQMQMLQELHVSMNNYVVHTKYDTYTCYINFMYTYSHVEYSQIISSAAGLVEKANFEIILLILFPK